MGVSHQKGLPDTYGFLMMEMVAGNAMYVKDVKVQHWLVEDSLIYGSYYNTQSTANN